MRTTILKYPLSLSPSQALKLPLDAKILSVAFQGDQLMLWAMLCPAVEAPVFLRPIYVFTTGVELPSFDMKFIGTATLFRDLLVVHVFEGVK